MSPKIPSRSLPTIEIDEGTTVKQFDRRGSGNTFTFFGPAIVELLPSCGYVIRHPGRTEVR